VVHAVIHGVMVNVVKCCFQDFAETPVGLDLDTWFTRHREISEFVIMRKWRRQVGLRDESGGVKASRIEGEAGVGVRAPGRNTVPNC